MSKHCIKSLGPGEPDAPTVAAVPLSGEQAERHIAWLHRRIVHLQTALGRIAAGRRDGRELLAASVMRRIAESALHDCDN